MTHTHLETSRLQLGRSLFVGFCRSAPGRPLLTGRKSKVFLPFFWNFWLSKCWWRRGKWFAIFRFVRAGNKKFLLSFESRSCSAETLAVNFFFFSQHKLQRSLFIYYTNVFLMKDTSRGGSHQGESSAHYRKRPILEEMKSLAWKILTLPTFVL